MKKVSARKQKQIVNPCPDVLFENNLSFSNIVNEKILPRPADYFFVVDKKAALADIRNFVVNA